MERKNKGPKKKRDKQCKKIKYKINTKKISGFEKRGRKLKTRNERKNYMGGLKNKTKDKLLKKRQFFKLKIKRKMTQGKIEGQIKDENQN